MIELKCAFRAELRVRSPLLLNPRSHKLPTTLAALLAAMFSKPPFHTLSNLQFNPSESKCDFEVHTLTFQTHLWTKSCTCENAFKLENTTAAPQAAFFFARAASSPRSVRLAEELSRHGAELPDLDLGQILHNLSHP